MPLKQVLKVLERMSVAGAPSLALLANIEEDPLKTGLGASLWMGRVGCQEPFQRQFYQSWGGCRGPFSLIHLPATNSQRRKLKQERTVDKPKLHSQRNFRNQDIGLVLPPRVPLGGEPMALYVGKTKVREISRESYLLYIFLCISLLKSYQCSESSPAQAQGGRGVSHRTSD